MTNRDVDQCNVSAGITLKRSVRTLLDTCFECFATQLLAVVHYIYTVIVFIKSLANSVYDVLLSTKLMLKGYTSFELIKDEVSEYQKVPVHMVFIFGSETVSYSDIVKIIEWCFPAGVSFISFYDCNNGVDPNTVFETVCKHAKQCIQNIKWGKSFSQEIKEVSRKQINGYIWKPELTVNIYRSQDGLGSILEVLNKLHHEGVRNVDQNTLNTHLSRRISAPDPDLAVVCGHSLSSYALLPWHLRITQFQLLESHHNISVAKFLNLLKQYSKCEQRYGK